MPRTTKVLGGDGKAVSVQPDICVLKVDQSELYPDKEFRKRAGRLVAVYVFDRNLHVHCCSFRPSYECHLAGTETSNAVGEKDEDDIRQSDAQSQAVDYYDARTVDDKAEVLESEFDLPSSGGLGVCSLKGSWPSKTSEAVEGAIEYLRANGIG